MPPVPLLSAMIHPPRAPDAPAVGPAAAERGVLAFWREVARCCSAPFGGKARAGAVARPAVREAAWAELSGDLWAGDGARTLLERNAAAWTRALGADAVLDLSREIGATWPALVAIAGASPDHAPAITRDLVECALELPSDEDEALFALVPLAASITEPHARRLCERLLRYLDWKGRPDLLVGHLAPVLARVAGPQGVAEVARKIAEVARWLQAPPRYASGPRWAREGYGSSPSTSLPRRCRTVDAAWR
ncbi:hypothetical protein WMF38_07150 [Sorangium sp. So ce118]